MALDVLDRAGVVEAGHRAVIQREDGAAGAQEPRAPAGDQRRGLRRGAARVEG
jgi:hypothetical protein